jgi:O-antigen/teichoic acid export membrane protein
MIRFASLVKDGAAIALGQATAAVGLLVGMRLLTEVLAPRTFGEFVLANGTVVLLQGLLFFAWGQAVLRYYSEYAAHDKSGELRAMVSSIYVHRFLKAGIGFLVAAPIAVWYGLLSTGACIALWLLVAAEGWRAIEINFANAARKQSAYACLIAADGIARPLSAALLCWVWEPTVEAALVGQLIGVSAVLTCYSYSLRMERSGSLNFDFDLISIRQTQIRPCAHLQDRLYGRHFWDG